MDDRDYMALGLVAERRGQSDECDAAADARNRETIRRRAGAAGRRFWPARRRGPRSAGRERRRQVHADEHVVRRLSAREGRIAVDGAAVRFASPRDAQAAGIATIFQELDLVPGLDVAANLFLGHELTAPGAPSTPRAWNAQGSAPPAEPESTSSPRRPVADLWIGQRSGRDRQGAVLRHARADHGRADRGADGGRGRAAVRVMRRLKRTASASSTSRTGWRRCRTSPTA